MAPAHTADLAHARRAMREAVALLQSHRNARALRVLADADKHLTAALARGAAGRDGA